MKRDSRTLQKLFQVTTTEQHDGREITYTWYRVDRTDAKKEPERLLTKEEADALQNYLREKYGLDPVMKEIIFPGTADLPLYSKKKRRELWKENDYPLPFQIEGAPEEVMVQDAEMEIAPQD